MGFLGFWYRSLYGFSSVFQTRVFQGSAKVSLRFFLGLPYGFLKILYGFSKGFGVFSIVFDVAKDFAIAFEFALELSKDFPWVFYLGFCMGCLWVFVLVF